MVVPITAIAGVQLEAIEDLPGIARAIVTDSSAKMDLSWDRYVRLKHVAAAVKEIRVGSVLDAGGYDGALALFLEGHSIDVIDPATTGGSVLDIPVADCSYDAVVAVDVLEHIAPEQRCRALSEFARVARQYVILNYPCRGSKDAQELALGLTNNALIKEHVDWELPDSDWVLAQLATWGYAGSVQRHTSIAIWLSQYVTLNLLPEAAKALNSHLILNYADEPTDAPLYHLLVCSRSKPNAPESHK